MQILITNDDGIEALGINELRKELSTLGSITVVAPDRERSASGHGITIHKPLRVHKMDYENCTAFAVSGTPADCVKLAIQELMELPPDIIVSGINSGANLGTDVLYSGTVSAAFEGIIAGIPSIAVSLALNKKSNYSMAAQITSKIIQKLLKERLPEETILNINVPDIETDNNIEFEITKLGIRKYTDSIEKRIDPRGYEYYWVGGQVIDIECTKNDKICTDISAIVQNRVSITPIHLDLTNYRIINELLTWNF
ncbi:MAG: 5'/3'-nucleotidase SurE [Desulfitibacter sp. BRH_c19]|nr:MAG: 5'/3'-nucleotidase SurE [Desulfitibacter sp. BRH_c19]